jgi:hypothetical protein
MRSSIVMNAERRRSREFYFLATEVIEDTEKNKF